MEVEARMSAGRRIATTNMAAGEAETQMHPRGAQHLAFLTPIGVGHHIADVQQVRVDHRHLPSVDSRGSWNDGTKPYLGLKHLKAVPALTTINARASGLPARLW
jgi:hypothetical protein